MATALVRGPGISNSLTISNAIATPGSTVSGTDPYLALVMQCKEEAKNKKKQPTSGKLFVHPNR